MEMLLTVSKIVLVLFTVAGVAAPLFIERQNYGFVWSVWKRFRIKIFLEALGILVLTLVVWGVLRRVPGLNFGWLNIFFSKGGNMSIGPILEGSESSNVLIRLIVPFFFSAFMFVLPFLAKVEEELFRKGYTEWKSVIKQSVKFGLFHCLVAGVPLAAGIALVIPGLFLGFKYRQAFYSQLNRRVEIEAATAEAVMVSTTYHTMSNSILFIGIIWSALVAV